MEDNYEISLQEIFDVVRKYFLLGIILCIIGGSIGYLFCEYNVAPKYTSRLTLYVNNTGDDQEKKLDLNNINASQKLVSTYIEILKSDTLLEKVTQTIDGAMTVEEIRHSIQANALNDTEIIEINVVTEDPELSWLIAGKLSTAGPLEILRVVNAGDIQVIDKPKVNEVPVSPNKKLYALLGASLGIIICLVIIFIREVLNNRVKSATDVENMYDIPLLAVIPDIEAARKKNK